MIRRETEYDLECRSGIPSTEAVPNKTDNYLKLC